MSNGIAERQNSEKNITRLAAQRQLYRDVGIINGVNIILSVIIPIGLVVIQETAADWTWAKPMLCVFSIVMLVVAETLSRRERQKKELAASIQQEFDVDVYQMPWDERLFGSRRNLNYEIAEASKKILDNTREKKSLCNWYAVGIDKLPINEGIAACQKENFNWDAGLRKRYRWFILGFLTLLVIVPIVLCLFEGQTVWELLIKVLIMFPACKWLFCTQRELEDDLRRMDSLERIVYSTNEKQMDSLQFTQKDIYMHRKAAVKVPDFVYKFFKDNDEDRERRAIELGQ